MSPDLRAFELGGGDAAEALDWLHVHAQVLGVLEHDDGSFRVWLDGPLPALPQPRVSVRELAVRPGDFAVTGREHDAAIPIAADLLVRPPWVERPPGFVGVELLLPRGNAFGSGEHGSTQAALRCLHRVWDRPASFADVGTGSGILALYASVRGCGDVQACDVDAHAVAAARELLPQARIELGGPERLAPADFVVANLTADELHAALPALLALWRRRSPLVLSGMRAHEVDGVLARLPAAPDGRETVGDYTAVALPPVR
ncbi:MAG: 50S ribosomal protein L11 methyltransferase [Planctomycetes bacterium]|nr:50S ribosomal protein L11 methyltransferase [Planctomycetota bacterium]